MGCSELPLWAEAQTQILQGHHSHIISREDCNILSAHTAAWSDTGETSVTQEVLNWEMDDAFGIRVRLFNSLFCSSAKRGPQVREAWQTKSKKGMVRIFFGSHVGRHCYSDLSCQEQVCAGKHKERKRSQDMSPFSRKCFLHYMQWPWSYLLSLVLYWWSGLIKIGK